MNIVHALGLGVHVCILKDADTCSEVLDVGRIEMCSECTVHVDLIILDIPLFNFREDSK